MVGHLHNSDVLMFLRTHSDNEGIKRFVADEQRFVEDENEVFGTAYKDFLDYLDNNPGDDSSFTQEELRALLK